MISFLALAGVMLVVVFLKWQGSSEGDNKASYKNDGTET